MTPMEIACAMHTLETRDGIVGIITNDHFLLQIAGFSILAGRLERVLYTARDVDRQNWAPSVHRYCQSNQAVTSAKKVRTDGH